MIATKILVITLILWLDALSIATKIDFGWNNVEGSSYFHLTEEMYLDSIYEASALYLGAQIDERLQILIFRGNHSMKIWREITVIYKRLSKFELTLIFSGIIALFALYIIKIKFTDDETLSKLIETVITTAVITFILNIITNRLFFSEISTKVAEATKASKGALELGLADISLSFNSINYEELISQSEDQIVISAIYSNTWIKNNLSHLKKTIMTKKINLEIILLDPEAKCAADYDTKFNTGEKTKLPLKNRIEYTIDLIKGMIESGDKPKGNITIFKQQFPYSYSLFCFDETMIIIPYLNAPGRTSQVPTSIYRKQLSGNCIYDIYINDLEKIKNAHSEVVWTYAQKEN